MRTPSRVAVLAFALSISAVAQKDWADKSEYDLFESINSEADPFRQIALLHEWEARYPQTQFQRERLMSLAAANRKAGKSRESFIAATRILSLDPDDTKTHSLIVIVGPTLLQPSPEDIATITAVANRILLPKPAPAKVNPHQQPQFAVDPSPSGVSPEAESQRVDSWIRDIRRGHRPAPDPDIARRAAAQAALDWIRTLKP